MNYSRLESHTYLDQAKMTMMSRSVGRDGAEMPARRMRVLLVSPVLEYPPRGGPALRVYTTIRALSECSALTLYSLVSREAVGGSVAEEQLSRLAEAVYFGRSATPRGAGFWGRVRRRLLQPIRRLQDIAIIAGLARSGRHDVIWLEFGNISYDLVVLKYLTRSQVVLDTDSVWSRYLLRETRVVSGIHNISVWCRGLWKRIQEVVGTNLADMTLAVSDIDAAYYRRISFSGRPVMVLHNAIEVTDYALPIDAPPGLSRPCICMTGSMGTRANTDAALWLLDRVMPIVWKKHPELGVYIVGKLPPASVRARASDRVTVTGQVESTAAYIRNSTVAVVPLRWESGTRFKILEAFACETPVVSTSLGAEGLPVVAGTHVLLADTPEDFAASVSRLLLESRLRSELTTNALALVDRSFGFRKATEQVGLILAALHALGAGGN